jgi:hypothetical protein
MEAKSRPQPSKPPEGEKWKPSVNNGNWRVKKKVTFEEVDDDKDDELEPTPKETVREVEKAPEMVRQPYGKDMPYKNVRPLNTGDRTPSSFNKGGSQANAGIPAGEKSYRIRAPIQREGVTDEVIDQIHNTEVMVKLGDLFGLSRELREGERLKLTKVRQPVQPRAPEAVTMQTEEVPLSTKEVSDSPLGDDALDIEELPRVGVYVMAVSEGSIPAGSVVAQDPYLQYLESLEDEERPKQVYVARESAHLRVTYPVINNRDSIESVLDSGSQIVSMALDQAKSLGLIWDPKIQIYMQSANGTMEQSVGMARNVQFKWGTMTVYLQVHIISNPAYKVLLGRPFDVLTSSRVENSADGGQVVTMTDPNSGRMYAVPTFDRGTTKQAPHNNGTTVEVLNRDNKRTAALADKGFRNSSRT